MTIENVNLQLFADDAADNPGEGANTESGMHPVATEGAAGGRSEEAKYTDADVDRLISQKFAEWQKKQEKKTSEAERLAKMTAEEKAAERIKAMEDKLHEYEVNASRAAMARQARAMLQDKNVHVGDELLANLIGEDAETTKASVESFLTLFKSAVEKAVKYAVKGTTPKTGAPSGLTKEQIMAVTNRAERQRLIRENMHLFNR